jgi:fructan beta-fructosidase
LGLNPGGPPGTVGSGTQYFIGDFDGTTFKADSDNVYPDNKSANWMDFGPDFYAAASYNGG